MPPITRRFLLRGSTAALAANSRPAAAAPAAPGLNHHAGHRGLFYGAAIDQTILRTDPAYMAHVPIECSVLVGEASFKWAELHPRPDQFHLENAERLMTYAARHGQRVRGHTLLWHQANPPWLAETLTSENAEKLLAAHISTVVRHFRGRLIHWDVVNEVLRPEDGKPGGLRDSLWFRALGPRMLDVAFHACAEADPHALRVINDYGLDYALPDEEKKRAAMLELLAAMKSRGVPVQAVGLQAHLQAGRGDLEQAVLVRFCNDIAAMSLAIIVTEIDVRDNKLPADITVRDAAVAAHGRAYLDAVLANRAVAGVLTWGLSDRRTWLNDEIPRADHLPQRPLPLDRDLARKPLWQAMADAFDAAPQR